MKILQIVFFLVFQRYSFKKSVLKNFAKFTGKHLTPATFLKGDSDTDVFL